MATIVKKEDFDKYHTKGFKIGDTVYIPEADIQAEIIAIDSEDDMYDVMIDATQINLEDEEFIGILTIAACDSETVYCRKKALKKKYEIWVNSDNLQHVHTEERDEEEIKSAKSEENDMEEDDDIEEDDDSDTFMIEDYLKDDSSHYSEFYLKPKYDSRVPGSSAWDNETYTGTGSLIEVNYDEADYVAIVFDSNNSSNNGELLGAILKSAERMSNADGLNQIIIDNIALATNCATVKDLIEDIVHDAYVDDIIRSYNWNRRGMCAVLIKVRYE